MSKVQVGLIETGFVADIHAAAARLTPEVEVAAVASPTPGKAAQFAREHGIPQAFQDYRDLLALPAVELVILALPNDLPAQACVKQSEGVASTSAGRLVPMGQSRRAPTR